MKHSDPPRKSPKTIYWATASVVLFVIFIFTPLSAFSFCRPINAVRDSNQALSIAIEAVRKNNWAGFSELGNTEGFIALLQTEPGCCRASPSAEFRWDYMTWAWSVDLEIKSRAPGFLVSLDIDHCGKPLWHGRLTQR